MLSHCGVIGCGTDSCHPIERGDAGRLRPKLTRARAAAAEAEDVDIAIDQIWHFPPVRFDQDCVAAVRQATEQGNYAHRDMISGAGHDACYTARVTPTSMIFIPCENGISHNEIENATFDDCAAGANVLLHAMLAKDNA